MMLEFVVDPKLREIIQSKLSSNSISHNEQEEGFIADIKNIEQEIETIRNDLMNND